MDNMGNRTGAEMVTPTGVDQAAQTQDASIPTQNIDGQADSSPVNQEGASGGKDPIRGLTEAVQAERRIRQETQRMLEQERQQYQAFIQQVQAQQQAEQQPQIADDDFLTMGNVKQVLQNQVFSEINQMKMNYSEQLAEMKHPDYRDVVSKYTVEMVQQFPYYRDIIAANPAQAAEMAYNIGKLHPAYQEQLLKNANTQVLEKVQSNLTTPNTLSNTGGGVNGQADAVSRIKNMSDTEFEAYRRKVINGEIRY